MRKPKLYPEFNLIYLFFCLKEFETYSVPRGRIIKLSLKIIQKLHIEIVINIPYKLY